MKRGSSTRLAREVGAAAPEPVTAAAPVSAVAPTGESSVAVPAPSDSGAGPMPTHLRRLAARHPRTAAVVLFAANALSIVAAALVMNALAPNWSGLARSLVAMVGPIVVAVVAYLLLCTPGEAGLTSPRSWRRPWLLAVPVALSLVPLVGGVHPILAGTLAILLVGHLLTGFTEELLWRGVVTKVLLPKGTLAAALLGSALFGAAHLTNVLFRDSVALVAAQAFGAACFGVGYAAVRLATGTIWPLMLAHAATDFFAAIGGLPKIPVLVGQDVVLLAFGLVLLLGRGRGRADTANRLVDTVNRPARRAGGPAAR